MITNEASGKFAPTTQKAPGTDDTTLWVFAAKTMLGPPDAMSSSGGRQRSFGHNKKYGQAG
jgi:hypothetical protein